MDFQAAPMEQVPIEASMDIHMDAAMNAAKDTVDAVDDFVQQLSSFDAAPMIEDEIMETGVNESAFAEPIVEKIVEQMQQSTSVPFFLIASTMALGVIVFLVIFHRRRRSSLAPKYTKSSMEGVVEPVNDMTAACEAVPTEVEVVNAATEAEDSEVISALCADIVEEVTPVTEPKVELVDVEPEPVMPAPEIPCISAMELEAEVPVAEPEVAPANVVEPQVTQASKVVEEATEFPQVHEEELKIEGAGFSTEAASETVASEEPQPVMPAPESPCISAVELEAEVLVAEPEVAPAANVVEPVVEPASDVVEEETQIPRVPGEEPKMECAAFSAEDVAETVASEANIVSSKINVATLMEL